MKENQEFGNEKVYDKNLSEQSPIIRTSSYFSEVNNFYNSLINQYKSGAPSEEDLEVADYFENNKRALQALSRENNRIDPEEVATALLYLAGNIANNNPFSSKDNLPLLEENYFKSKDLFMKSCEKAYPNLLKIDLNNLDLSNDFPKLSIFKNFNELSPKQKLQLIDSITATQIASESGMVFNTWRDGGKMPKELVSWAQEAYKLQLLRDKIQKDVYGNANVSSEEVAKIDALKQELTSEQSPKYEKVTEENIEAYVKQQKSISLNGEIYKTLNFGKDGEIFIERPISIKEALVLAEKATEAQTNSSNINTGITKTRMFSITKEDFIKKARWITQSLRSVDDPQRQQEVREAQELQRRIQSGEFEKNWGGSLALLLDVLEREAKRLNDEKELSSKK